MSKKKSVRNSREQFDPRPPRKKKILGQTCYEVESMPSEIAPHVPTRNDMKSIYLLGPQLKPAVPLHEIVDEYDARKDGIHITHKGCLLIQEADIILAQDVMSREFMPFHGKDLLATKPPGTLSVLLVSLDGDSDELRHLLGAVVTIKGRADWLEGPQLILGEHFFTIGEEH